MESRVTVLEQIARMTSAGLERIERHMDLQTAEIRALAAEHRSDFRWLPGIMLANECRLLARWFQSRSGQASSTFR
jgi:hypothetical protein